MHVAIMATVIWGFKKVERSVKQKAVAGATALYQIYLKNLISGRRLFALVAASAL